MMLFNAFVHKYNLKNKTTSSIKINQLLSALPLNDVVIFSRDEPFVSDIGIVNLHSSEGTHWVAYINGKVCDSYGCAPPQNLSHFIIKQN